MHYTSNKVSKRHSEIQHINSEHSLGQTMEWLLWEPDHAYFCPFFIIFNKEYTIKNWKVSELHYLTQR